MIFGKKNIFGGQEIWQYGSNEAEDPVHEQDGVAPQCPVGGIDNKNRAFIPDEVPKGFISSHSIENYKWIFARTKNDGGYVTPGK